MVKKYLLLSFLFTVCISSAQSPPPPPPGCVVFEVIDDNNDGFTEFDINYYLTYYRNVELSIGFDFSGYQLLLYPSETDYNNNTNLIVGPLYTNIVANEQFCMMKFIYSGSGPEYSAQILETYFRCHKFIAIPYNGDVDQDGVINTLEDLNNNNILTDSDTDGDGIPNYLDNDDDGDGILTINEDANLNGNYLDDDENNNGIPNYLDATTLSVLRNNSISFSITPNPASNTISITFDQVNPQNYDWSIVDITGKIILKSQKQTEQTIDISGLKSGIYFIKVGINKSSMVKKLIVL